MPLLYIRTHLDGVLSAVAPLGLAASASTALVVDVDPEGPLYPGRLSLADLIRVGPRADDLAPVRAGLAVLRSGGVHLADAAELLGAFADRWPCVVVRLPSGVDPGPIGKVVQVLPLLPSPLAVDPVGRSVLQTTGLAPVPSTGHLVLPRPARNVFGDLLRGVVRRRSRWIRAWRPVWEWSW
ncbi:MAG: hypothetical protein OEO77_05360 [Acidimicrobiia bacterium]|nr:hypothetical protein [Acidimicrobiia bacterium]